jgi:hypothetical protein
MVAGDEARLAEVRRAVVQGGCALVALPDHLARALAREGFSVAVVPSMRSITQYWITTVPPPGLRNGAGEGWQE